MTTRAVIVPPDLWPTVHTALIAAGLRPSPVAAVDGETRITLTKTTIPAPTVALSPRERQALSRIASGMPNSAIGHDLGISLGAASSAVSSLLRRLKARDRANAVHLAWQRGLLGGRL